MINQSITKSVSNRICSHMNKALMDSILKYASYYAGISNPTKAEMLDLNSESMTLNVDGEIVKIDFDHVLKDSKDAHITLVQMIKNIPD